MKYYFEFSEHEYYALITVTVDENDLETKPYKKASQIYFEYIGGDSLEEILNEASPLLRTKEYAFMKFAYAPNLENRTLEEIIRDFEETQDGILLIDGSLI